MANRFVKNLKLRIGSALVPLYRLWIRYLRLPIFRGYLWSHLHWRPHDFVVSTRFGGRFRGNTEDLIQRFIYYFEVWEPDLTAWISGRLLDQQNRIFVDVGANIGYFTILAAKLLANKGQVVAIEASPTTYDMLISNIKLNGLTNVQPICCAAMEVQRRVTLYQSNSSNIGETTTVFGKFPDNATFEVQGIPLANLLDKFDISRIRLIKMDIEGGEWHAMEGLIPILDQLPGDVEFIIEITPTDATEDKSNSKKLTRLLSERGFNIYKIANYYDENYYFNFKKESPPRRVKPANAHLFGDYIFSRIDAETL